MFGFSFSWKRALGISAEKAKISREIGIPLTKSGRERKLGAILLGDTRVHGAHRGSEHSGPHRRHHRHHGRHLAWGMIVALLALFLYSNWKPNAAGPVASQNQPSATRQAERDSSDLR